MSPREIAILGIIAVGLSVTLSYEAADLAPLHKHNRYTFFESHATYYRYYLIRKEWRPRLLSHASAHLLGSVVAARTHSDEDTLKITVGLYTGIWAFLTNVLFICGFKRRSLFYMLGVFAAVTFGYMPGIVLRTA